MTRTELLRQIMTKVGEKKTLSEKQKKLGELMDVYPYPDRDEVEATLAEGLTVDATTDEMEPLPR